MTCKDKLKNFMNYSLPIIFIVFLVGTISDPYFDKRSLANKRRTYHDFKNATMSIIIKEWERSYYNFDKLNKVTYILTKNNDIIFNFLTALAIFNIVYFKFDFYKKYRKFLTLIIDNPFWGIIGLTIIINNLSNMIPVLDTKKILFSIFIINLIEQFCYLNNNNINYYINGFFRRTN